MSRPSDPSPATPVVVLEPANVQDLGALVCAGLARAADDEVVIDLRRVGAVDPPLLRALLTVAAEARPGSVALTGATPEVHKALHVAGVATLFRRI